MSYEVATLAFQVHANYRTWSIDFAPPPLLILIFFLNHLLGGGVWYNVANVLFLRANAK